jgi:hypothetical protein
VAIGPGMVTECCRYRGFRKCFDQNPLPRAERENPWESEIP